MEYNHDNTNLLSIYVVYFKVTFRSTFEYEMVKFIINDKSWHT